MTYTLRPHQSHAIGLLRNSFGTGHKRPMLQAPTGAGKTLIAVDIIKSALDKGKHVLFVVDRIQLIDQTSEVFDKWGLDHGVIQSDHWRINQLPLQLASAQTITRRKLKPFVSFIIVDEAHSVYKSFTELLLGEWARVPVVGLSATPFTKGLGKIYDDLIVVETTQGLINSGHLSDFVAYGPDGPDLNGIKTQAGDYNQKQLGEAVNKPKIVGDVVSTWLRLGENRQTLCFAVNVAHSKSIIDEFRANGVAAEHFDAFTEPDERKDILARFESGETKILSNVGITTKGFDSPGTSCLILARPTKSLMLYIQMVGRVLRSADGKKDAIILDHGSNVERLGFPTDQLPEYLCNGDKQDAKSRDAEKKEKLPTACEKCFHLSTSFVCPKCGHVPEVMPGVEAEAGTLKKLAKNTSASDKARWYGMLKGFARERGYKDGWSYHKYHEKFGVYPTKTRITAAIKPDKEVRNWILHLQIKGGYAKKKGVHMTPEPGFDYSLTTASDGSERIRVEKDGKWVAWATQTQTMKNYVGMQ